MEKIELSLMEYNGLIIKSIKYEVLKNAMKSSIRKYVSGNGLYLDSDLLKVFELLFPADFEKRAEQLRKEGDPE